MRAVDLLGPTPLEVIEGFEHGEAGVLDPLLDAAVLAHGGLAFDQLRQIIQVRAPLLRGFGGEGLVVALDVVELQTMQLRIQSCQVTGVMLVHLVGIEVGRSDVDIEQVVATGELQWSGSGSNTARVSRMLVILLGAEGLKGELVGDRAGHGIGG